MKAKTTTIAMIAILILLTLVRWETKGQDVSMRSTTSWEYKVSYRALKYDEKDFNNLGQQGWELVVAEHEIVNGRSSAVRYIYKRPSQ